MNAETTPMRDRAWGVLVGFLVLSEVATTVYFSTGWLPKEELERNLEDVRKEVAAKPADCPPTLVSRGLYREVEFTTDFYGVKWQGDTRFHIDEYILYLGAYEKHMLYFMRDTMKKLAPGGGVFVDVGANTGQHSVFMVPYSKVIHAIEPYPPALNRFRKTIELNGLKNIVIHDVGLADAASESDFFASESQSGGSFAESEFTVGATKEKLRLVRGDDLLEGTRIDMIKMDIEGYEKLALKGLTETIKTSRPIIVVEVTVNDTMKENFKSIDELRAVLPESYDLLEFDNAACHLGYGLYVLKDFDPDFKKTRFADTVAVPREKRGAIMMTNKGLTTDPMGQPKERKLEMH
ncbi:MAG: FkbM family methyltransferase [Deltaproteobacteria bacterium]|nr:FkbM family methyltransferase [Deltaproteobacteria bacterium]